ncbi:MAG TPA: ACT domain-containing protein [Spirochaetota bacterium]|nr:ACT domain-containing protein [Spirochaetota bacterium]HPS87643.1 ACT domain-containing protein [Spirochaetota bacterium]
MRLKIKILPGDFTIFKLPSGSEVPEWVDRKRFYSVTDTGEEMSIICSGEATPEEYPHECSMKIFKIDAELEFSLTGVLNSVTSPLAEKKIPVFTVSTFNTDYFFIKMEHAGKAVQALEPFHDIEYYGW